MLRYLILNCKLIEVADRAMYVLPYHVWQLLHSPVIWQVHDSPFNPHLATAPQLPLSWRTMYVLDLLPPGCLTATSWFSSHTCLLCELPLTILKVLGKALLLYDSLSPCSSHYNLCSHLVNVCSSFRHFLDPHPPASSPLLPSKYSSLILVIRELSSFHWTHF